MVRSTRDDWIHARWLDPCKMAGFMHEAWIHVRWLNPHKIGDHDIWSVHGEIFILDNSKAVEGEERFLTWATVGSR